MTALQPAVRVRLILLGAALGIVALAEWTSHCGIGGGVHTSLRNFYYFGDAFFSACWLAGALTFASSRRSWRSLALYVAVGAVCEAYVASVRAQSGYGYRLYAGSLFGMVGCVWAAVEALLERTQDALLLWLETLVFPALLLAAILPLDLTLYLHPTSLDGRMVLVDQSLFGGQPAWAMGRFFETFGVFRSFELLVYVYLPTASGLVYLLERKTGRKNDLQVSFLTVGMIGIVLLQLAPVAGPTSFRPDYPFLLPDIEDALTSKLIAGLRWRNSIPSLHTTWSLLIYWHARPHGLGPRLFGAAWVVLTIMAMLGLGEHFLADVAITIPFAVAMRATFASNVDTAIRKQTFTLGALFYLGWVGILRAPESVLANSWLLRGYAICGVATALYAERRLYLASPAIPERDRAGGLENLRFPKWVLGALFLIGLLATAAARTYHDRLAGFGIHRGAALALVIGAAGGLVAGRKLGPVLANVGFAAAAVVASYGWDYLPSYLEDFDAVSWGDGARWIAHDVMAGFFVGPAAFFAGAGVASMLPEKKLHGLGSAVIGSAVGVFVSTNRVVFALIAVPVMIVAALLRSRFL